MKLLYVLGLAATVLAQTTELQIFNAGETTLALTDLEASVVGVNAEATTLAVSCKSNAAESDCALESPITITEGPSTYSVSAVLSTKTLGVDARLTIMQKCDITSSTKGASCSASVGMGVSTAGISTSTSTTLKTSYGSDEIYYEAMTVTAGVSKLTSPQATQTPDAAAGNMGHNVGFGGAAAAAAIAAVAML